MLEGTFFVVSSFRLLLWRCPDGSLRYDLFMSASLSLVLCGTVPEVAVFFPSSVLSLSLRFFGFICNTLAFFLRNQHLHTVKHTAPKAKAQNAYAVWRTEANEAHITPLYSHSAFLMTSCRQARQTSIKHIEKHNNSSWQWRTGAAHAMIAWTAHLWASVECVCASERCANTCW